MPDTAEDREPEVLKSLRTAVAALKPNAKLELHFANDPPDNLSVELCSASYDASRNSLMLFVAILDDEDREEEDEEDEDA